MPSGRGAEGVCNGPGAAEALLAKPLNSFLPGSLPNPLLQCRHSSVAQHLGTSCMSQYPCDAVYVNP